MKRRFIVKSRTHTPDEMTKHKCAGDEKWKANTKSVAQIKKSNHFSPENLKI